MVSNIWAGLLAFVRNDKLFGSSFERRNLMSRKSDTLLIYSSMVGGYVVCL